VIIFIFFAIVRFTSWQFQPRDALRIEQSGDAGKDPEHPPLSC
jgi:hypothetical protein